MGLGNPSQHRDILSSFALKHKLRGDFIIGVTVLEAFASDKVGKAPENWTYIMPTTKQFLSQSVVLLSLVVGMTACDETASPVDQVTHPWMQKELSATERAEELLAVLTLEQKFQQLVGNVPEIVPELPACLGARHVRGIAELNIPTLRITNGPVGIGQNDCVDAALFGPDMPVFVPYTHESSAKATALPSAMAIAASFDTNVADRFGQIIAAEANALALHVFEAPGVNLARLPVLGRNFEYGGEDPYLSGLMAVTEIRRIQSEGVIAMAKHFAANEQETNRFNIAQRVDEQVLRELYLLPFEMAVKDGDVASLMCSYNDLNGAQACENDWLLTKVLREDWGFEGYVQSDFFAAKSTVASMKAGLDHLMPRPLQWAPEPLQAALDAGELTEADIDQALRRRYVQMFRLGVFDRPLVQTPIDIESGGVAARDIGTRAAVLLQNNGALPFSDQVKRVVVIGKASQVYAQQAVAGGVVVGKPMGAGGGSSDVVPHYTVAPVEGIRSALISAGNADAEVSLVLVADDNSDVGVAIEAARNADAVVIMAGTIAEEGADRATFEDERGVGSPVIIGDDLDWYAATPNRVSTVSHKDASQLNPGRNSQTVSMIEAIMTASPEMAAKTALVLKDNAGVAIPDAPWFLGAAGPAILEVWFPGQEDGNIVADLLFGTVNPSGKSPVTYPVDGRGFLDALADNPMAYPGVESTESDGVSSSIFPGGANARASVVYEEGLNIGYRWYDANVSGECAENPDGRNPCVAFPFGHGLSYTTFELNDINASYADDVLTVDVTVTNTGKRAGSEVVQVYLGVPAAGQPPKRLVAFEKIQLDPGATGSVSLTIDSAATHHPLSVFNETAQAFERVAGDFKVYVGRSSSTADLTAMTVGVQ